ncbi:MAG: hypothetical protein HY730_06145, partial [Candidatus Tectomicrobia bacterium]|nr:hypothetical protein [Candidatus Tectomicrobia bacterium]
MMFKTGQKLMKEKLAGAASSASGITSILGSYQVCHNLWVSAMALLGVLGITVAGMPLLFLTKVALPFWIIARLLFIVTLGLYVKKHCISRKLLIFNLGLITIGMPFQSLQSYSSLFWLMGGALV